jgi:raffinose/stachyose/melibiose transport system substrate-binding protein
MKLLQVNGGESMRGKSWFRWKLRLPVKLLLDITPKNEGVKELAQFDVAGWNLYSVLSSLATSEKSTPDILMNDVIPKLMTSEIDGEQAAKTLHEAATYNK